MIKGLVNDAQLTEARQCAYKDVPEWMNTSQNRVVLSVQDFRRGAY